MKMGRVRLNGRYIYSAGRDILSGKVDLVIFSDGSSVNLTTGVVTNLSPNLPLFLDKLPEGFEMPKAPEPVEKRYVCRELQLNNIDRKVIIMPRDSNEIVIPAHENLSSSVGGGAVVVTWSEPEGAWTSINIQNLSGMRMGNSFMSILGDVVDSLFNLGNTVINVTSSVTDVNFNDTSAVTIYVPFGTSITIDNCEDVEIGDVRGSVKIESGEDVSLRVGQVETVEIDVTGEVSVTASEKADNIDFAIDAGEDVTLTILEGCAKLNILTRGDVKVVASGSMGDISVEGCEIDFQGDICLGEVVIESDCDLSFDVFSLAHGAQVISRGDVDFTFGECEGDIDIKSTDELTLSGSTLTGNLTVDTNDEVTVDIDVITGDVVIESTDELTFDGKCLTGNLQVGTNDAVTVNIDEVHGDLDIDSTDELILVVKKGEVGDVSLEVNDDATVTIKTVIASINASVTGDGMFRIKQCLGDKSIDVDGDRDVEFG